MRALVVVSVAMACGAERRHVDARQHPWFDAPFEEVFTNARDVITSKFRVVAVNPDAATIKTGWQRIGGLGMGRGAGSGPDGSYRGQAFIRIDVAVVGPRPYEVRVVGRAALKRPEDVLHSELKGGDEPAWLGVRVDAIRTEIYERLRQRAVPTRVERAP